MAREVLGYFVATFGVGCKTDHPRQNADIIYVYKKVKHPVF